MGLLSGQWEGVSVDGVLAGGRSGACVSVWEIFGFLTTRVHRAKDVKFEMASRASKCWIHPWNGSSDGRVVYFERGMIGYHTAVVNYLVGSQRDVARL